MNKYVSIKDLNKLKKQFTNPNITFFELNLYTNTVSKGP